jgi:hypothetical protein
MRKPITLLVIGAAFVLCTAVRPAQDDDIVWPTYLLVEKSYDKTLTCSRLRTEIDRVNADIKTLIKARLMSEKALRQAYDTQSAVGREQGGFLNTGTAKEAFSYAEAREQIKESRRIAELRRDHLMELLPSCKQS